jgi:CHAT domain-containing protein
MRLLLHFLNNILNIKHIKRLFFFAFFLFTIELGYSQKGMNSLDSIVTGNYTIDSIRSDEFFESGIKAYKEGNSQLALDNFLKCLSIRRKIYLENNSSISFAVNRVGIEYKDLGRLNEAVACFQEVIKINTYNYGNNTYRNGTPYTNIGNVYQQKGNFEDAIVYLNQAIRHYQAGLSQFPQLENNIVRSKYNLADNYYLTKHYTEALEIVLGCYRTTPYNEKASFLNLLGNIYASLKDNIKAKMYFELSIEELVNNTLSSEDSTNLADLYFGYSQFLISTNDFKGAETNLKLAEPLVADLLQGKDLSNLYFSYGELFSKKPVGSNSLDNFQKTKAENLATALNYYQKAIIALSNNFSNISPTSNPTLDSCQFAARTLQILQRKAETYFELAQLIQNNKIQREVNLGYSLLTSKLASDLLNNLRTGTVSEESKIVMTQFQNSAYFFTVKVASELFNLTGKPEFIEIALQNAERNKAASLLDNLSDENARQSSLLPDSLIRKEEDINDQITIVNQYLFEEKQLTKPDSLKIRRYEEQLFQLNHEKNDLERFLEVNFKDYYQLKYADDKIMLSDVQKKLDKEEVILEYVFDKSSNLGNNKNLYIFLVSKNDLELRTMNIDSTIYEDIDETYRFLSANDFINIPFGRYNRYINSANNLYNLLIKPVEQKLANKSVTIIPDGKLNYIPFDALLFNRPQNTEKLDFKNLDYLIKKFSFNYCYSIGLYLNKYKTEKHADKKLLAFAPIYGEYKKSAGDEFNHLTPLSGIIDEVKSISKKIESKVFIGENATESNFRNNYKDYDILHLAMHAILNDSIPMFSKLAFSPETDSSKHEDGWLTTSELYNLKLNSRLAVLSACNTGSGVLMEGEGVISLARGFFYAECPSVIMTLWEVEDRSGAEIMSEFYRLLNAGKKKPEALRLAKLKHIKEADPVTAHPHVWLSYVSIGKPEALYSSKDYYFFIIILVVLIIVVIDQLYKNKKARKSRA